jgi:hypothetical protein
MSFTTILIAHIGDVIYATTGPARSENTFTTQTLIAALALNRTRSNLALPGDLEDAHRACERLAPGTAREAQDRASPVQAIQHGEKANVQGLARPAEARLPYRERRIVFRPNTGFRILSTTAFAWTSGRAANV